MDWRVMTITEKLTAALKFDAKATGDKASKHWKIYRFESTVDIADHFDFGARYESARLAPLHLALVECVKALMEYADEPIHYIKDTSVDFDDEEIEAITVAAKALASLAEVLKWVYVLNAMVLAGSHMIIIIQKSANTAVHMTKVGGNWLSTIMAIWKILIIDAVNEVVEQCFGILKYQKN